MRKIGIVSEYFYPHLGGITEHVYFYAKELTRRGFEVVLITGHKGEKIEVSLPPGLRVVQFTRSMQVYANGSIGKISVGWNLGKKVKDLLEEEKFDLLHLHNPLDPVLPLLFLKYTDTLTVGTFHTYFPFNVYLKIFGKIAQNYLNKLDHVICAGPASIKAMKRYLKFEPSFIPNGVDVEWFSKPPGLLKKHRDGSPKILFLGRLDPRNGLDHLLEAFTEVLKKVPEARLIIAGDGPLRSYYEKKAGAFLGKNVFFEGPVTEARPDYYAICDVFCFPAEKANFSVTLLEALASGKPFVGVDNLGFRTVIEDGVNGLLVRQKDPPHLAEALVKVLQDKSLADKLARNGRKAASDFSWSRITDQVLDLYNQIYERKKGVRFAS